MRALVTGVTGQDGWYLSQILQDRDYEVFGLVAGPDTAAVPPGVHRLDGDMRDSASLRSAINSSDPHEIYNLAAVSSVAQSWQQPELVADVNGLAVIRLLSAMSDRRDQGKEGTRLVQASSAEMFGSAAAPQNEQTPLAPITPYGAAKAFAHNAISVYRQTGVWAASVILYNHESPRRPESFVSRKITRAVARIAGGADERLLLGNLESRRDWGFAGDYADAMVRVARHTVPDDFVVASGTSHSIADFAGAAFRHVGIEDWRRWVEIDPSLERPRDAADQRGDAAHLRRELGWTPSVDFDGLVGLMVDAEMQTVTRDRIR